MDQPDATVVAPESPVDGHGGGRRYSPSRPMLAPSPLRASSSPPFDSIESGGRRQTRRQRVGLGGVKRLVISAGDDQSGTLIDCESSHEYIIRPDIPKALKFILGPVIIAMQCAVFGAIYKDLSNNSCTDYYLWNAGVKLGIPLATVYVACEISSQLLIAARF